MAESHIGAQARGDRRRSQHAVVVGSTRQARTTAQTYRPSIDIEPVNTDSDTDYEMGS